MIANHAMLKEIKIADIRVGSRHRRDMGDLTTLAESIRREGLLQPIGVTDPDHEDHDGLLEWAGGSFDPEAFGPAKATKAMRQGLPDWRRTV